MSISTLTASARRELARRVNGGLEITLYWHPDDDGTSIDVHQTATEETISFPVPADRALDAFHHPFVHLAEQEAAAWASDKHPEFDEALIFGEGGFDQRG
jgi:hypothetical protein